MKKEIFKKHLNRRDIKKNLNTIKLLDLWYKNTTLVDYIMILDLKIN